MYKTQLNFNHVNSYQRINEMIKNCSNNRVDAEKSAGSRVLLAQHPRPSRFSAHDRR